MNREFAFRYLLYSANASNCPRCKQHADFWHVAALYGKDKAMAECPIDEDMQHTFHPASSSALNPHSIL